MIAKSYNDRLYKYTDDITQINQDKHDNLLGEIMQNALNVNITLKWWSKFALRKKLKIYKMKLNGVESWM